MAFQTVGARASHKPKQHQPSATVSHETSGLNGKAFLYGNLASIVAEFGTFPMDLTKMQLQVQDQSIDAHFNKILRNVSCLVPNL